MNPLLLKALPCVVAGAVGFTAAWGLQALRLTSLEQDFTQFKQDSREAVQTAKAQAAAITKETDRAIPLYVDALHQYYRNNPVIRMLPATSPTSSPVSATPGEAGCRPTDYVAITAELENARTALEACGVTTVLFLSCRDWAKEQAAEKPE